MRFRHRLLQQTRPADKDSHLLSAQMDFEQYAESEETPQAEIKAEKIDTAAPASVAVAA